MQIPSVPSPSSWSSGFELRALYVEATMGNQSTKYLHGCLETSHEPGSKLLFYLDR